MVMEQERRPKRWVSCTPAKSKPECAGAGLGRVQKENGPRGTFEENLSIPPTVACASHQILDSQHLRCPLYTVCVRKGPEVVSEGLERELKSNLCGASLRPNSSSLSLFDSTSSRLFSSQASPSPCRTCWSCHKRVIEPRKGPFCLYFGEEAKNFFHQKKSFSAFPSL